MLRRLQEAGLGVFIPLEELQANPVPNAVALMTMSQAGGGAPELPEGCQRFAVTADGTETAEQVSALKGSLADLVLFRPSPDLSYTHVGMTAWSARGGERVKSQGASNVSFITQ